MILRESNFSQVPQVTHSKGAETRCLVFWYIIVDTRTTNYFGLLVLTFFACFGASWQLRQHTLKLYVSYQLVFHSPSFFILMFSRCRYPQPSPQAQGGERRAMECLIFFCDPQCSTWNLRKLEYFVFTLKTQGIIFPPTCETVFGY